MISTEIIIAGALGGLARAYYTGLVTVGKNKKIIMNIWFFTLNVLIAAILGVVLGFLFDSGIMIAAIVGYVGTDIIGNVLKGVLPKQLAI
jgi:hypothetical protein